MSTPIAFSKKDFQPPMRYVNEFHLRFTAIVIIFSFLKNFGLGDVKVENAEGWRMGVFTEGKSGSEVKYT